MSQAVPDDVLLAAAAEYLYIQAVNDCLRGDVEAADGKLDRLGCKWRISSEVWAATAAAGASADVDAGVQNIHAAAAGPGASAAHNTNRILAGGQQQRPLNNIQPRVTPAVAASNAQRSVVYTLDQALPAELLHCLQETFSSSSSDFWQQHNYNADDTPFFSYLIDLAQASLSGPSNALEAAALLLQQHIKQLGAKAAHGAPGTAAAAAAAGEANYVEWWAHTRPMHAPHQLHFDAAELAFRRGLPSFRLVHPSASSVLYLTSAGGPTLVMDQDVTGDCCWQLQQQQQQHAPHKQGGGSEQQHAMAAAEPAVAHSKDDHPPAKRARAMTAAAAAGDANREQHAREPQQQALQNQQSDEPLGCNTTAAAAAEAALHASHHSNHQERHQHHHQHQHHEHYKQQHQSRPPLSSAAYSLSPKAGRFCIWPGNRLHGVLPAAALPLGEDVPAAAAEEVYRTTLIFAWWKEDPRTLVPDHTHAAAGDAADRFEPAGPALYPCMTLKHSQSQPVAAAADRLSSDCAAPRWIQAMSLKNVTSAATKAIEDAAAGAAGVCAGNSWYPVAAVTPAWEPASSKAISAEAEAATINDNLSSNSNAAAAAAAAAGDDAIAELPSWLLSHPLLRCVELPCLRFFLRTDLDIRQAYIPELTAWQQHQDGWQHP